MPVNIPTRERLCRLLLAALLVAGFCPHAQAAKIRLQDGRQLEGLVGMTGSVAQSSDAATPPSGGVSVKPILILDDGLRRTFLSKRIVSEVDEQAAREQQVSIKVEQRVAESGSKIGGVGPIVRITPFDEFGRRIFSMRTKQRGVIHIVQGITEITPTYTTVEALQGHRPYIWKMKVSTNSIPRETLSKIIHKQIDSSRSNQRLEVVRLYIQSDRYKDALTELEQIIADFPDLEELKQEARLIRQMGSRRLLREIEKRASAGQHRLVRNLLANFPSEGVAGNILQNVRETQAAHQKEQAEGKRILELLEEYAGKVQDTRSAEKLKQIVAEIKLELNPNTLPRMASFLRLSDDEKLSAEQKVSLGISGWLIGSDYAIENLLVSLSLYDIRGHVKQYLSEPLKVRRLESFDTIKSLEGASVENVARIIANMKPPLETEPFSKDIAGYYKLHVPGLPAEPDVEYFLQLPPEYDPYRRYPLIVTLNGGGTNPEQQLRWWAGDPNANGIRMGQAARHGYIVLSVNWQKPHQVKYEFSAREHHAVLSSLRDACRRFSVDTDRVFLSGHSIGGDAAWDIALSHPDLWAGAIPIVAMADRYCSHYWQNAEYVPFYFVAGEYDGSKMSVNARELDRYLRRGFDTTVVEYLGRGHEHFYDDIQNIFDWMNLHKRDFYPKEFECSMMRSWDNYFWWVEMSEFPEASIVDPIFWPPQRGTRAAQVTARITKTTINVRSSAKKCTLWLSPELIDFKNRVSISVNRKRVNTREPFIQPELKVLLEDARSRGDRLHPFWARIDTP